MYLAVQPLRRLQAIGARVVVAIVGGGAARQTDSIIGPAWYQLIEPACARTPLFDSLIESACASMVYHGTIIVVLLFSVVVLRTLRTLLLAK